MEKGVRYEWHCRDFIGAQVDLGLRREFLGHGKGVRYLFEDQVPFLGRASGRISSYSKGRR
jgi:hypothetical protein